MQGWTTFLNANKKNNNCFVTWVWLYDNFKTNSIEGISKNAASYIYFHNLSQKYQLKTHSSMNFKGAGYNLVLNF